MNAVPVLAYHSISDRPHCGTLRWSVSPADFDEQMALLRQRERIPLTVSRYADLLRRNAPLPPGTVLVTFDDGYADLATTALPVLLRYGISATAFVITSRLGTSPPADQGPSLDWYQLAQVYNVGVEIGSHSHTHPDLDCLRPDELDIETAVSKRVLEDRLGAPVSSFAYPFGYYNDAVRRAVRRAGYSYACAVKNALSHAGDDTFAIARVLIERDTGVAGIDALLDCHSAPLATPGQRLRTRAWRACRRARHAVTGGWHRTPSQLWLPAADRPRSELARDESGA
jgi:peptidoglycan/xylan/chitin deacetylase (PgdA/CDA1 family)